MFSIVKNKKFQNAVVLLSLAIGSLLFIYGFSNLDWAHSFPYNSVSVFYKYITLLFTTAFVAFLGLKYTNQNIFYITIFLYSTVALISGTLWPLLITVWFAFASLMLGKGVFILLGMRGKEDIWIIELVVGAGVYGTIVGLLAHFPINYPGVYAVGMALPLVIGWSAFLKLLIELKLWCSAKPNEKLPIDWLELSIVVVSLIHYVTAFMPEVSHDALAVHLFIPSQLSLNHHWNSDVVLYVWAVLPLLADWIFSIAYMLGGETASRLFNVGFAFIICGIAYQLVLWGRGSKAGAKWVMLIILSTPLTYTESSALFADVIWTAFVISGVFVVLYASSNDKSARLYIPVSGLLLGFALASKLITVMVFPALLCILVFKHKKWLSRGNFYKLGLGLILFLCTGSIPYITAWIITDNPVFPFYNELFKSEYFPLWNFNNPLYNSPIHWDTLYDVTFNTSNYLESGPGAAGFQWLVLLVPSVLALSFSHYMRGFVIFFVGILTVILVFQFQSYLRYIFPSIILLIVVIGLFLSFITIKDVKSYRLVSVVASLVVCVNLVFLFSGSQYKDFPLLSILDKNFRKDYLEVRMPIRNAVNLVNELNKSVSPVAFFSQPFAAGLKSNALHPNWYNNNFQTLVTHTNSEQAFVTLLEREKMQFLILDENWGDAKKRRLIKRVTDEVQNFGKGSISVRTVRDQVSEALELNGELLLNVDFTSTLGWNFPADVERHTNGGVVVSVTRPISQTAPVIPSKEYLKSIKAYCPDQPSQGRLQINWLDVNSKHVSADLRVFDCIDVLEEHTMSVIVPPDASFASIYATSHGDIPIVVKEIRFNGK